jgi:hypothetical protein
MVASFWRHLRAGTSPSRRSRPTSRPARPRSGRQNHRDRHVVERRRERLLDPSRQRADPDRADRKSTLPLWMKVVTSSNPPTVYGRAPSGRAGIPRSGSRFGGRTERVSRPVVVALVKRGVREDLRGAFDDHAAVDVHVFARRDKLFVANHATLRETWRRVFHELGPRRYAAGGLDGGPGRVGRPADVTPMSRATGHQTAPTSPSRARASSGSRRRADGAGPRTDAA